MEVFSIRFHKKSLQWDPRWHVRTDGRTWIWQALFAIYANTLTEVFPCFSSVVRQMPGLNSQSRGTDRISSELLSFALSLSLCCAIVFMLFCCYYVVLLLCCSVIICVVLVIVLCYCLYAVLLLLCCTVIVLLCYYLCCACHCVILLSLCCSVVIMLYCYCVALLLFVLSYVLIVCTVPLPPGVNPIAVDKYIYLYD